MIKLEVFNQDQFIFKEGDMGDKFYLVLSGQVDCIKKLVLKGEVKPKRVALFNAGTTTVAF